MESMGTPVNSWQLPEWLPGVSNCVKGEYARRINGIWCVE